MGTLVALVIAATALLLVVVAGHRMLLSRSGHASGLSHALGSFIDVFDPGRARADRDLQSQKHRGPVTPSPDDDDPPVVVDLDAGQARISRPRQATRYPADFPGGPVRRARWRGSASP